MLCKFWYDVNQRCYPTLALPDRATGSEDQKKIFLFFRTTLYQQCSANQLNVFINVGSSGVVTVFHCLSFDRRQGLGKTRTGLHNGLPRRKGRQAQVPFSTRTKARIGNGHDLRPFQNGLKGLPAATHTIGQLDKDVRRIDTTVHVVPDAHHGFAQDPGVFHVVINQNINFGESLVIEAAQGAVLHNVGSTVKGTKTTTMTEMRRW
jgi:hypothetical protein